MTTTAEALLPVDPSGPALAAAVAELRVALDNVRAHTLAGSFALLNDAAVAEATIKLQQAEDSTAACAASALARTSGCGYAQGEGFVTPAIWLRSTTNISQGHAAGRVRTATRLAERYPATLAAWVSGRITEEHAAVIAAGVDRIGQKYAAKVKRDAIDAGTPSTPAELAAAVAEAQPGFEATFLDLGRRYTADVIRTGIARTLERVDPDGAAESAMDAFDAQTLTIKHVGEMAVIALHATREIAAALRVVLDQFRDVRYRAGVDKIAVDGEQAIDPVTGKPPVTRQDHQDAIAFGDWVNSSLGEGLGSGKQTERPHLDLLVSLTDLQHQNGSGVATATGVPIPAVSIARIGCDADVTLFTTTGIHRDPKTGQILEPVLAKLLGAPAEIVGYGRTQRIVPADLRRALAIRDQGCAFPYCHRIVRHTQAHHIIHWIDYGLTEIKNCVLLCSRHHHLVHEGGWTITPRAGMTATQPGCWEFQSPAKSPDIRPQR